MNTKRGLLVTVTLLFVLSLTSIATAQQNTLSLEIDMSLISGWVAPEPVEQWLPIAFHAGAALYDAYGDDLSAMIAHYFAPPVAETEVVMSFPTSLADFANSKALMSWFEDAGLVTTAKQPLFTQAPAMTPVWMDGLDDWVDGFANNLGTYTAEPVKIAE